jgi:hypothetical protein
MRVYPWRPVRAMPALPQSLDWRDAQSADSLAQRLKLRPGSRVGSEVGRAGAGERGIARRLTECQGT